MQKMWPASCWPTSLLYIAISINRFDILRMYNTVVMRSKGSSFVPSTTLITAKRQNNRWTDKSCILINPQEEGKHWSLKNVSQKLSNKNDDENWSSPKWCPNNLPDNINYSSDTENTVFLIICTVWFGKRPWGIDSYYIYYAIIWKTSPLYYIYNMTRLFRSTAV